jgi:outer membrane protein assembly factor BamB
VRPDGELVCLAPDGRIRWTSGPSHRFGLGPFLIADDKLLVMDDHGELSMAAVSTGRFELLARAKVLEGHDSWGPMALAGGLLIVRDLTEMRCLDLRQSPSP